MKTKINKGTLLILALGVLVFIVLLQWFNHQKLTEQVATLSTSLKETKALQQTEVELTIHR